MSSASSGGGSLGGATIKVTPEELNRKADVVQKKISAMSKAFTTMLNTVKKTDSYWIGDAGDAHRNVCKSYESSIEDIFKRLSEHVTDLNSMAGVYSETESKVEEEASALPTDLIS